MNYYFRKGYQSFTNHTRGSRLYATRADIEKVFGIAPDKGERGKNFFSWNMVFVLETNDEIKIIPFKIADCGNSNGDLATAMRWEIKSTNQQNELDIANYLKCEIDKNNIPNIIKDCEQAIEVLKNLECDYSPIQEQLIAHQKRLIECYEMSK